MTERSGLPGWRNAIMIAFGLGGVTVSAWGPRLPTLQADLGIGTGGLGVLLAGVTVGSLSGLLIAPPLLNRFGARRALPAVLVVVALGLALIGVASGAVHSLVLTGAGFVVVGLAIGSLDVMINVEGSAVERAAGRTLLPLMHASWSAGAIIGSAIGAVCAAFHIAPVYQFAGEAVAVTIVGVVSSRFIPSGPRAGVDQLERQPIRARLVAWANGWRDLRLLAIGLVMLGVELGEGTANNWLTLAVRDGHAQPEAIAAGFFTAFAIGETLARVFGGPLVDRLGRVRTVRVTTALGIVGMLLFIFGGPAWVVLIGVVLWAVGVSMGFPLGMSAAADSGTNPAARVSVVATIGYVANLGGPPAIGFLAQGVGLIGALWLVAAFFVISFVGAGALRRSREVASD